MIVDTVKAILPGTILALDTSTSAASASLSTGGGRLLSVNFETTDQVSRTLFGNLRKLFDEAGLAPENVDRFGAVTGPGSFTGLRVGLSAIESMARTLKRPIFGVTAFDAIAGSLGLAGRVVILIEAGKGELFYGVRVVDQKGRIEASGSDGSVTVALAFDLLIRNSGDQPIVITGSGALKYSEEILDAAKALGVNPETEWSLVPSTPFLSEAVARIVSNRALYSEPDKLRAYYIKPSDAERKRPMAENSTDKSTIDAMSRSEIEQVIVLETSCGLSSRGARGFEKALLDQRSVILVARLNARPAVGSKVVGVVAGLLIEGEFQIDNVVVDAAFRRRGFGTRLLQEALNVAFGKGARTSVLEVRENNHETRVLYEKLGFRTVGRRKDYYTDPQDDALTMLLEMREPDSTLQPQ
jgi:tRNA threonylcarbamoyl adenosine modification protein YeaZ/ribosomal-protein-alanine acetyltransferase